MFLYFQFFVYLGVSIVAILRRAGAVDLALLAADLLPALVVVGHPWLAVSGEIAPDAVEVVGRRCLALPEGDDVVAAHIALVGVVVPVPVERVASGGETVELRRRGHSGRV